MLGGGVEEDLLGQGEDADTDGANSGDQVDHVLALVLVIDLQISHDSKVDNTEILPSHLFPGLGGDSHLVNAGSGPVSQGLPSGLVLHQPAGSEERTGTDHLLSNKICLKTEVNVLSYHRIEKSSAELRT